MRARKYVACNRLMRRSNCHGQQDGCHHADQDQQQIVGLTADPDGRERRTAKKAKRAKPDGRENSPVETTRVSVVHRRNTIV